MQSKNYKDLIIWQKSNQIFEMICEDIKTWPNNKIANAISYQLLDSGGSMSANVAEGYGRGSSGEFEQFLRYSRGSLAETDNWLYKTMRQGFITENRYKEYQEIFEEIKKMTSSFISKLRKQNERR